MGPMEAPTDNSKVLPIAAEAAQRLAYYQSDNRSVFWLHAGGIALARMAQAVTTCM